MATDPPGPVDVLVAVPAHDEVERVAGCLTAVVAALREGRRRGLVRTARVGVAPHRCTDGTAAAAAEVLAGCPDVQGVLREDAARVPVGAVRTALVRHAAATPTPLGPQAWVFSTDADSLVPPDWVSAILELRRRGPADLVLGLADLDGWDAGAGARQAYEEILAGGMTATGHTHAYAANLAMRLGAFEAVGGFPALPHGEEHGLAAAARAAGLAVLAPLHPRVRTSARMPGRAPAGLGSLLTRLAEEH